VRRCDRVVALLDGVIAPLTEEGLAA